jgi:4-hydroxybenzoate polyprenyltransferase
MEGAPPGAWLLALFMTCFGMGIALAKDIPDIPGDRAHGIRTVAVRRGSRAALRISVLALSTAYFLTAAAGLVWLPANAAWALVAVHLLGLGILLRAAREAGGEGPQCRRFYRWVWRLFYAEYVAVPSCLLLLALPARL